MTAAANAHTERHVVFISKGTPNDDQFVLWLAPRLEAHGYSVFADILTLKAGDSWRREITDILQDKAVKMLLCCSEVTLNKTGVQEEIGIADEVGKRLKDNNFTIPLRLSRHRKLFGIGELQCIDFEKGWAAGLADLLDALAKLGVPRDPTITISPAWEAYRRRFAVKLENSSERLTSNWLRIMAVPDTVRYFQPSGAVNIGAMGRACSSFQFPAETHLRGFFSLASLGDVLTGFETVGKFEIEREVPFQQFFERGIPDFIQPREASNLLISMMRRSWENYCRAKGLAPYTYAAATGFHASEGIIALGKKVPWGRQGERRSAMLRNKAQGKIWQFGVSGNPLFFPFPHFRLKARVLFAAGGGESVGEVFKDKKLQHRFRRTVCKGWRNKQWLGRLLAFLELLSGEEATIKLPVGSDRHVKLDATPVLFTSPVSTVLPNILQDEDEEHDNDTLGASAPDDEEDA
jgi:hypothetical protein